MPSSPVAPSHHHARVDTIQSHRNADERQPLLASSPHPARYDAELPLPPQASLPNKSPYLTSSLRLCFIAGFVLLLVSTILLLLLLVNLFVPVPLLLPPHRSPATLPIWFCLTSILIIAPGLLVFELASRATRAIHVALAIFNLVSLVLVCAVYELRTTHAWLGIIAISLSLVSTLWSLSTSHILAGIQIPYAIHVAGGVPIVAHISAQEAQAKWSRTFKVLFAVIGTAAIGAVMALLTFNVSLDAADAGFRPVGNLTRVSLVSTHVRPNPTDPPTKDPLPTSFRLHLACEQAAPVDKTLLGHGGGGGGGNGRNSSVHGRPIALVMTERGVSGVIGAQWLRDMVERTSRRTDDAKDPNKDPEDDGHLSLSQVCFWDRMGHGYTDFVNRPFSIAAHTDALYQALVAAGRIDDESDLASTYYGGGGKNRTALGRFLLVSTGFGSLFARDFAATYPHLVHSQLLIDAETPETWYTDAVPLSSGLRAGYAAPYHGYFGSLYSDLLPALVEPLGVTRLLGLLGGRSVADRILAPGFHGGAHRADAGGGGWRIRGAGGANARLLTTSWYERLDANLGKESENYKRLKATKNEETWREMLKGRPTAVNLA
ncbi:hypothetical protein ACQY0O_002025 [Thecaphora frezii]